MAINGEEKQDSRTTLYDLIQSGDGPRITGWLEKLSPADVALHMTRLDQKSQTRLLELIGPEKSADILSKISGMGAAVIVERIPAAHAAPIFNEMGSDQQVEYLRKLKVNEAELILREIQPDKAKEIRQRMSYPENTAGALMTTEYLSYTGKLRVEDVLRDLHDHGEAYSDLDIQYPYVISDTGKLMGVLRMRDLLLAPKIKTINEIMIKDPLKVDVNASLQELRDFSGSLHS